MSEQRRMNKMKYVIRLWFCVWLLVSLLSLIIQHTIPSTPLLLKTLVVTLIMVPTMVYLIVPALSLSTMKHDSSDESINP